ncbi:MAG TPA: efflux RND transporter periplasmic adaptor subunit [Chitinophagaceae bacterium]|nr:efflux RND transporter periplasmic adaptor subunit [Chitinophagaceae bacterium]
MLRIYNVLFLLVFVLQLFACNSKSNDKDNPLALPAIQVDTSTATIIKDYIGSIEGKVNVEITSQVDGILQEIFVDEGEFVHKGQLLFKIDPSAYQEILNNAIANENVERAKLRNAELEIERIRPLVENEVIAEVQLEVVNSNFEVAKASLAKASAAVASAKINLDFTEIRAPVQGYIGRFSKRIGNLVSKGDKVPLTVLTDVSDVYVYFSMSESDYLYFTKNKFQSEDSARSNLGSIMPEATLILADGIEYGEKGIIDAVSGQVNKNTGSIFLRASFPNSSDIMRSGNTATIKLKETKKGVIMVPQEVVTTIQDRTFVYVLDDNNKVKMQSVKIDGVADKKFIIIDGLKIGDILISTGFNKIEEGIEVRPLLNE